MPKRQVSKIRCNKGVGSRRLLGAPNTGNSNVGPLLANCSPLSNQMPLGRGECEESNQYEMCHNLVKEVNPEKN